MTQTPLSGDYQNHEHLLQLASQGDTKAIAALMNRHLIRQQIVAQAEWTGNELQIYLEAVRVPTPEPLLSTIQRTILKLQVQKLKRLKVSCQQVGAAHIAWSYEQEIALRQGAHSGIQTAKLNQNTHSGQKSIAEPISLQDWLNQKAQTSLVNLLQPLSAADHFEAELRFLRFFLNTSDTALLPLTSIRQVMKVQPHQLLPVPDMPAFVIGIGNFHGEMLWMVHLGLQLGFKSTALEWNELRSQFPTPFAVTPLHGSWIAIVIQIQGRSLGLVVPSVVDIESYDSAEIQLPTTDLFSSTLLPFIQGYLVQSSSPILDAKALIADRRFQVNAA